MLVRHRDPRRPEQVKQFTMPVVAEEDLDADVVGFMALALGGIGLLVKHKFIAWAALVASVMSVINNRSTESDLRQGTSALMFTGLSLTMLYIQMFTLPLPKKDEATPS